MIIFLVLFLISFPILASLGVPIQVKETAGVGAENYPIHAVIPLPYGEYQDTEKFILRDANGKTVPAQFDVLNRWWAKDKSIRHVVVKFQPSVEPFTNSVTGINTYTLTEGIASPIETPLQVAETESNYTVNTGPLKFTVKKKNVNLIDNLWFDENGDGEFSDSEQEIKSNSENGGVLVDRKGNLQRDSVRTDVKATLEESGPMRAVIRLEAVTKYVSTDDHTHGWAVRIYAYAGKPYVKIDYQLQNSAKNKKFAWPLYFKSMNLDFKLNTACSDKVRIGTEDGVIERSINNSAFVGQTMHDKYQVVVSGETLSTGKQAPGFLTVGNTTAMTRYFWETWPNGLKIDANGKLSFQLWPEWSSQWMQKTEKPKFTYTDLYWLEDMQHVYKEMMLVFHKPDIDSDQITKLAKNFHYHPVATLPVSWYAKTKSTLDMDGRVPLKEKIDHPDQRRPVYSETQYNTDSAYQYNFGWAQFLGDVHRKWGASQGGGWPYAKTQFIATENPSDYYEAEQFAIGELNMRPQWMAQYSFTNDWPKLKLTENPYSGASWRALKGGNFGRHWDAPFIPGTGVLVKPRDDQHGWFYHMENAYYFTGNPWIKDWYQFVGEFRKTALKNRDPYPDSSTRGKAHRFGHALQAYRVTGDPELLAKMKWHIKNVLLKQQDPKTGAISVSVNGGWRPDRASWVGYLTHNLITYYHDIEDHHPEAEQAVMKLIGELMRWNMEYGKFDYNADIDKSTPQKSTYGAQNLADPMSWYYLKTQKPEYREQLMQYIKEGINGGDKIMDQALHWKGQFQGRYLPSFLATPEPSDCMVADSQ